MTKRWTVISTDCHAGLPTGQYRDFLEQRYHAELDQYMEHRKAARAKGATLGSAKKGFAQFSQQFVDDFRNEALVEEGGPIGGWDFTMRKKELDADGIVGEVIYPGPVNLDVETSIPFQGKAFFGDAFTADSSLSAMWAGARAYNRWLASMIDRSWQAGLALIPSVADVDEVLAEIAWAAAADFRGVIVRQMEEGLPPLYDFRYDPIWAACAEAGLPVHFHGGVGKPTEAPTTNPAEILINGIETAWYGYRPVWGLIVGGVFERHPKLRAVFTESHASWVPNILDMMDARFDDQWLMFAETVKRRPSEYWYENCYVGASFLSRAEVQMADLIGVDGLTYGNDYPHVEGIWPQTPRYLHEVFAGTTPELARKILAENPARMYRLDLDLLDRAAAVVGPEAEAVLSGAPSPTSTYATDRMASRAGRPAAWVMGGVSRKLWGAANA
jgi:predicted TIM-barrel fold metal-dependent hydrolase